MMRSKRPQQRANKIIMVTWRGMRLPTREGRFKVKIITQRRVPASKRLVEGASR